MGMTKEPHDFRTDGFANVLKKYGTTYGTSEQYIYQSEPLISDETLAALYESNGLFARIINMPSEDALRCGFELEGIPDRTVQNFYQTIYDNLNADATIITSVKWARLFGGAIAIMLINDGRGIEEPLNWENIRSIDDIVVYDRSLVQPNYNTLISGSTVPERFIVSSKNGSFEVHQSRCLIFKNGVLPEMCSNPLYEFWGMPEYIRTKRAIKNAEVSHAAGPRLLANAVQAVYKMKNLSSLLATECGGNIVAQRLETIDMMRGLTGTIAISSDDEFAFKQMELSGVANVIDMSFEYLSAVTFIPQVLLSGNHIKGFKDTDDLSTENYCNLIERMQGTMVKSNLRKLLRVIFQAGIHQGIIPKMPPIRIRFRSLRSLTAVEQAENERKRERTKLIKAQTAETYIKMGAIKASEIRKTLSGQKDINAETMIDRKSRNR